MTSPSYERLLRIADRLAKVEAGSEAADLAIHEALGRGGSVPAYTTEEEAARALLPPGFEWMTITSTAGWVYAPCRRAGTYAGGQSYPHHGQWGRTIPLSMCGSVLRAWAPLTPIGNEPRRPGHLSPR